MQKGIGIQTKLEKAKDEAAVGQVLLLARNYMQREKTQSKMPTQKVTHA